MQATRWSVTAIPRIKRSVRSSVALSCLAYMANDWVNGRRLKRGRIGTRSGATHAAFSLDQSLDYIERIYSDYLAYAAVERVTGTIAEIGPGDNFGVALMFLGAGADAVHALDRYRSHRDPEQQRIIYRALSERHGLASVFEGAPGERSIRGLVQHAGQPAETFFEESGLHFDAILSRAVMEHLYDPLKGLNDMLAALRPGGVMVHRVDLRDHGMFLNHHPLSFLTIADPIYRRMTRNSGRPNRMLLSEYRRWLESSGAAGSLRITRLVGIDEELGPPAVWDRIDARLRTRALEAVTAIRPRLARRFRAESDQDLAVAGCVLVVRKPSEAQDA